MLHEVGIECRLGAHVRSRRAQVRPLRHLLVVIAMVATGFTGCHAGARSSLGRGATFIMSLTMPGVLVVDLDRPARGLIQLPVQALIDAQQGKQP